jgi:hypothetical protein
MISFPRKLAATAAVIALLAPLVEACADTEVHSVYAALDASGDRRRSSFFTDTSTIYCDADYAAQRLDITFNAVIRQVFDPKGGTVPLNEPGANADIVTAIGELDPGISHGVLSLQWSRPMDTSGSGATLPFPAGWYRCEYFVDGIDPKTGLRSGQKVLQGQTSFRVDYIFCPVAGVTAGTLCRNYVQPGTVGGPTNTGCKGTDASKTYKCDEAAGVWVPL